MSTQARPLAVLHVDLERGWRGGQQQVAYLVEQLAALGVENRLAVRAGEPLARLARERGWPVVGVRSLWSAVRLAGLARRESIAIVHAHSARAQNLGLLVRLLAPRVRLVVARRVDFHRSPGLLSRWKYSTALVDRWIAISERVRDVLIEDGVAPERTALVYSGVDTERYRRPPDPAAAARTRRTLGIEPEAFLVGTVGALVEHKDQATLIRAAALASGRVPNLRVVIAGEGPLRLELERLIARLGLGGRVKLLGHHGALGELYPVLDLFAMPSRMEGLGTSVIDAMAVGLPVVVTAAGGLPELVQHERNGLVVPPEHPEALAEALCRMAEAAELRRRCGAANREDAERFSARATAEATLQVYRGLLPGV
ncbi:MAG: glycosyltransferase family 4 protein [Candidatus Lambdaproteobacteria bacterium]|nr:glycosyltransferase family 4 protein [Candidatus Lambdaproteobacteria bacterium]